jgi:NADPH:quinone reductase-like Zn-dependent oxidoreductase
MKKTMNRAVVLHEFGGPEVLQIEEVETPAPGAGEVLLRVRAIGLNRTELTLRSGRSPVKPPLPSRIGFEAAGEILALGPNVSGLNVGERVALVPTYGAAQYGLYGETSLAPERSLVKIPAGETFADAAATWVAFGTAWSGLIAVGQIKAGQTVLITAASSSVGLAAIQIAKRVGARPIALTRRSTKVRALSEHKAYAVIATEEQDVEAEVKRLTGGAGADLVFDAVGGSGFYTLGKAAKTGGLLLLYGALDTRQTVLPPYDIFARNLTIRGFALPTLARDANTMDALTNFVSEGITDGTLKPTISRTFSFDDIVEAHRFLETGAQIGKIVVTV